MPDLAMLATAVTMGATCVRVGFEDSAYYLSGQIAPTNAELVEKLADLIRSLGYEIATPAEARAIIGLKMREK